MAERICNDVRLQLCNRRAALLWSSTHVEVTCPAGESKMWRLSCEMTCLGRRCGVFAPPSVPQCEVITRSWVKKKVDH